MSELSLNNQETQAAPKGRGKGQYLIIGAVLAAIWWFLYSYTLSSAQWVTYELFGIEAGTKLGGAVEFFLYDTVKIFLLLFMMIYVIAWIRSAISVERVRDFLAGKKKVVGYFMGSGFGAVTPFCSCSSIPLFLGFTSAQIPLGITMSFLITSPLINEIAVVMLWSLLGWKFTVLYIIVGLLAGIVGGAIMDALKAERWLQPFVLAKMGSNLVQTVKSSDGTSTRVKLTWDQRHEFAKSETMEIFHRVWKWIIIGVGIGAAIHGFVPENFISDNLGDGQWWSVPLAVVMGLPLYTNVTGIIPVMESLLIKGLPIGTTLALCMSTVVVSIPEFIMLKQVMRWQLLLIFAVLMMAIFTLVGWFFNLFQFTIA